MVTKYCEAKSNLQKIYITPKAVNTAVLAEFGMYPFGLQALKSSVGFQLHIFNSNEKESLSYNFYIS